MDILEVEDPLDLYFSWFEEAKARELRDPNAVALSTVDSRGMPSVRMVLIQYVDKGGFVFYTNLHSQKGRDILENNAVALCYYWKSLNRQIRIQGTAQQVPDEEAEHYFETRPVGAQLGAWASQQSQPLKNRKELESRISEFALKYDDGPVPRPKHWSGFRIRPFRIEFWRDRPFRLHDRYVYNRVKADKWEVTRLYP